MKPVTVKELKKHGRIHGVYIEETDEDFQFLEGKDELDTIGCIAGLQIITTAFPDEMIEVTPVMKITDNHIAVCRLRFRRCKNR